MKNTIIAIAFLLGAVNTFYNINQYRINTRQSNINIAQDVINKRVIRFIEDSRSSRTLDSNRLTEAEWNIEEIVDVLRKHSEVHGVITSNITQLHRVDQNHTSSLESIAKLYGYKLLEIE